jgi:hypothetical protein
MRKGFLVGIVVVSLLVMLPMTALASDVTEASGTASCEGFEFHVFVDGGLLIQWTASLQRWDAGLNGWVVEDSQTNAPAGVFVEGAWDFPATPPANPDDGQWQAGLPDGEYRAVLGLSASNGWQWEDIVQGITLPCSPPTGVTLASFDAAAAGEAIVLNWTTAAELNSLGFNVYRAAAVDSLRSKLNSSLIASMAPGSPTGASYQFVDDTARAGVTYYYWLQEVGANGQLAEYGPVSAQFDVLARLRLMRPRLAPTGFTLSAR